MGEGKVGKALYAARTTKLRIDVKVKNVTFCKALSQHYI